MKQDHKKANLKNTASSLGLWTLLILSAIILAARLVYIFFGDAQRFPIATVKVAASYEHVTHKELEYILSKYLTSSFFALPMSALQKELSSSPWIDSASLERLWPDTLKIKLVEKKPIAMWDDALMTEEGQLFRPEPLPLNLHIPRLMGPEAQRLEVLQVYKKLSKILLMYGLEADALRLRDNQSWLAVLSNGTKIYLGKNDLDMRLLRFCKTYPAVFAEKADQLVSVDLRYPRGMAVQWKQQTGR